MKLLERAKLPDFEQQEYIRQAKQFNITASMGDYFVFSNKGSFLGYTDVKNEEVHALLERYPLGLATQVKFKVYPFVELSMRHKVAILDKRLMRMDRLMELNPDILFSLNDEPVFVSYHEDAKHMVSLDTLKKVFPISPSIMLPCRYRKTMKDVCADMSIWLEHNEKQVKLNFIDELEKGLSMIKAMPFGAVEVLLYGHLLGIEIIQEDCKTKLYTEDRYVSSGWDGIPLMRICKADLISDNQQIVIQRFWDKLVAFFDTYEK